MSFLSDIFKGIFFIINLFVKTFKALYEYKIISYIINSIVVIGILFAILYFGTKP